MLDNVYKIEDRYVLYSDEFKQRKSYIFDIYDGEIYKLNELGYFILSNIDGVKTLKQIVDIIYDTYLVDYNILINDINGYYKKLLEKNIIIQV